VFDDGACCLSVDQISIGQGINILQHRHNGMANVFKNEGKGLQTSCVDVKLGSTIFVKDGMHVNGLQVSATMAMATATLTWGGII